MSDDIVVFCEVAGSFEQGRARAIVALHLRCVRSDLNEHGWVYGLGLVRVKSTRGERERCMDFIEACDIDVRRHRCFVFANFHARSTRAERERLLHFI